MSGLGAVALRWVLAVAGVFPQIAGATRVSRAPLSAGEHLVESVVASVELENDVDPVFALDGDLRLLTRADRCVRVGGPMTAEQALAGVVDEESQRSYLELLVGELVVARAAARASEDDPGSQLVGEQQAVQEEIQACGQQQILRASRVDERAFEAMVLRRLVVRRYLLSHAPRMIEPTERDLRAAYEDPRYARLRERGESFAVARRGLREALVRRSLPGAVRQFLRSLGSRARVTLYEEAAR